MSELDRILEDLEHQLDVLESALATGQPVAVPAPFAPPASPARLEGATKERAEALQRRLLAAQELVASDLERTRQQLALTEGAPDAPRFLDTTF